MLMFLGSSQHIGFHMLLTLRRSGIRRFPMVGDGSSAVEVSSGLMLMILAFSLSVLRRLRQERAVPEILGRPATN